MREVKIGTVSLPNVSAECMDTSIFFWNKCVRLTCLDQSKRGGSGLVAVVELISQYAIPTIATGHGESRLQKNCVDQASCCRVVCPQPIQEYIYLADRLKCSSSLGIISTKLQGLWR